MNLENILAQALEAVASASEIAQLEEIRVNYLGKKGEITSLLKTLGKIAPEERKEAGQARRAQSQEGGEDQEETHQGGERGQGNGGSYCCI